MQYDEMREAVLQDLVFFSYVGIKPILIHGGGAEITKNLKKKGIDTRFVDGLRVTSKEAIEVVVETLKDLNRAIVDDINRFGGHAEGLSGHDAEILLCKKHQASEDVGYVGDVTRVNIEPIRELTKHNIIPVISGVGFDEQGATYNINADEAASKVAAALPVRKIMMLTNVKGILRDPEDEETLMPSLHVDEVQQLIERKIISGGMIPKIKAGISALQGGFKKAHIVYGRNKHSLLLEIFTDRGIGTEIMI